MSQCDVCGHEMEHDGIETRGAAISLTVENSDDLGVVQKAVPRHKVPFDYAVCFSCWLESLGIKGNRTP